MTPLLLAVALVACAPADPDGFSTPEPTPTPVPIQPADWWGWASEPITGLTETEQLGEDPGCVQALEGCADDYYAFPAVAADHARPVSASELQAALEATFAGVPPLAGPTSAPELGAALGDALNLGFLLVGLHARPLEVRTIRIESAEGYDELELLFVDPYVGTFRGRLRLPDGVDWGTPILGVHGHGTEAVDIFDVYGGAELVDAGHPVLAIDLRVNYADELEDDVQRTLLRAGFSLLEIRVYEVFRALQYLRGRGDMEPGMGLLAHRGGAGAMNVAIRLNPGVTAYAFDNTADYDCWLDNERLLDDSVPAVHPYRALINDFTTAAPALLRQDYGFPEGPDPLVAFFP
jgi:hypothetical protein